MNYSPSDVYRKSRTAENGKDETASISTRSEWQRENKRMETGIIHHHSLGKVLKKISILI
jgi:hypothetical protein